MEIFNLHNYHFIWYILGFLLIPKVALAVIVSVYTPISLWLKIIIWILAITGHVSIASKEK